MISPTPAFSIAQARHIVKDLFTPSPLMYWTDFLLSAFVGMACFWLVRRVLPPFSLAQAVAFALCCLSFYRAVLFTHELTHLRDRHISRLSHRLESVVRHSVPDAQLHVLHTRRSSHAEAFRRPCATASISRWRQNRGGICSCTCASHSWFQSLPWCGSCFWRRSRGSVRRFAIGCTVTPRRW